MNKLGIISLLLISATGCSEHASEEGTGRLQIRLDVDPSVTVSRTKSSDATTFTLDISRDGDIVRTISPIGEAPDPIELTAGDYLLTAYSEPFETPRFDTPVYGGSAQTRISVGKQSEASVCCAQTNAGVRISYTDDFAAAHPVHSASVRQIEGILNFEGDDAERTGYFLPGSATLVVTAGEAQYEQELTLEARKLYLIEIDDTPEPTSGRLSVSITVSTDVTEEQVQILFPSGRIDYLETMGAATVSTATQVAKFTGWSYAEAEYTGAGVTVSAQNPSSAYVGFGRQQSDIQLVGSLFHYFGPEHVLGLVRSGPAVRLRQSGTGIHAGRTDRQRQRRRRHVHASDYRGRRAPGQQEMGSDYAERRHSPCQEPDRPLRIARSGLSDRRHRADDGRLIPKEAGFRANFRTGRCGFRQTCNDRLRPGRQIDGFSAYR